MFLAALHCLVFVNRNQGLQNFYEIIHYCIGVKNMTMSKLRNIFLLLALFLSACTTIGPAGDNPAAIYRESLEPTMHDPLTDETPDAATQTPASEAEKPHLPSITPAPATYFNFDAGVNPLTGQIVHDPVLLDRRPVMVKVSNWPREGRPHAGLTNADLVFEYYIGHQMNRFLAVYYGKDDAVIGPVRSGRLVDAQLVQLYQGLLAYGDADPQVDQVLIDVLGERALAFSELPCPPMCGETTHSATGVFADSGAMTAYAEGIGIENITPDLRGLYFQDEALPGDGKGNLLRVEYADFSIMVWRYNQDEGNYQLWMEGESADGLELIPMVDRNNEKPVSFDNLVVMYAEYIEYAPSLHDIVIQNVLAPQPALFFRDGIMSYGTWRTPDPERPIIFEDYFGNPMPLKPGRTWVVIAGMHSITSQPAGGEWKINFGLP
jgi:hypothetical protein